MGASAARSGASGNMLSSGKRVGAWDQWPPPQPVAQHVEQGRTIGRQSGDNIHARAPRLPAGVYSSGSWEQVTRVTSIP